MCIPFGIDFFYIPFILWKFIEMKRENWNGKYRNCFGDVCIATKLIFVSVNGIPWAIHHSCYWHKMEITSKVLFALMSIVFRPRIFDAMATQHLLSVSTDNAKIVKSTFHSSIISIYAYLLNRNALDLSNLISTTCSHGDDKLPLLYNFQLSYFACLDICACMRLVPLFLFYFCVFFFLLPLWLGVLICCLRICLRAHFILGSSSIKKNTKFYSIQITLFK